MAVRKGAAEEVGDVGDQDEDFVMEERTRCTFCCCCFQELAGMFMSLTCSSERGGSSVWSFYTAGWKNDEGVKAFSVRMKMLEGLQGFSSQPSGMEESLGMRARWAFLGI